MMIDISRAKKSTMGGQLTYEKLSWIILFAVFLEVMLGFYACNYVCQGQCIKEGINDLVVIENDNPTEASTKMTDEVDIEDENSEVSLDSQGSTDLDDSDVPNFEDDFQMEGNKWTSMLYEDEELTFNLFKEPFEWATYVEDCSKAFNFTASKIEPDNPSDLDDNNIFDSSFKELKNNGLHAMLFSSY